MYLATPLTRTRYVLAKGAAVFTALLLVTLGPPVFYLIGLAAQSQGPDGFGGFLSILGRIAASGVILALFFAGFSLGASAFTDRKAVAAAIIFFSSQAISVTIAISVDALHAPGWLYGFTSNAAAFSLVLDIFGQGGFTVSEGGYVVAPVAFAFGTAFWTIAGFGFTWYRYSRLRVTR